MQYNIIQFAKTTLFITYVLVFIFIDWELTEVTNISDIIVLVNLVGCHYNCSIFNIDYYWLSFWIVLLKFWNSEKIDVERQ